MEIICASICYRGFAEDEVVATLENAPAIGYRSMEIHGPITWTVPAVKVFDLPAMQARVKASGMRCAGIATINGGGEIGVAKTAGRIDSLEKRLQQTPLRGTVGIGHTRWAAQPRQERYRRMICSITFLLISSAPQDR